ncbi:unnamed protein product [Mucor hiemalis]
MYSITTATSYIPSNYYQQMERRMSYSDYLSCSSQGSFSDYEHSPATLSEEYSSPPPPPSSIGHHHQQRQQKYFVPSMNNMYSYHHPTMIPSAPFDCVMDYHNQHMMFKQHQLEPVYDSMYNHQQQYQHHASDASSPTPSSTSTANSSPVTSPKMPCQVNTGGGKKKVTKSTRAKRNAVSRVTKQQQQQQQVDDASLKTFPCEHHDCGKVFRRAEHLKRHIRSIHTREKRKLNLKS